MVQLAPVIMGPPSKTKKENNMNPSDLPACWGNPWKHEGGNQAKMDPKMALSWTRTAMVVLSMMWLAWA